jgi:hypothetical protein
VDVATDKRFKSIRKSVFELSQKLEKTQFGGMDRQQYTEFIIRKQQKREKDAQKSRLKDLDRKHINSGALRSSRLQALQALTVLPDQHSLLFIENTLQSIDTPADSAGTGGAPKLLTDGKATDATTGSTGTSASASASASSTSATAAVGSTLRSGASFASSIGDTETEQRRKETRKDKKERLRREAAEVSVRLSLIANLPYLIFRVCLQ